MINLDTSVLVRYVAQDDPVQSAAASRLLETELIPAAPGRVGLVVLAELAWVLERSYGCKRDVIVQVIQGLLAAPNLVIEARDVVVAAIAQASGRTGVGLADALIHQGGLKAGCVRTVTFDKRLARVDAVDLLGV